MHEQLQITNACVYIQLLTTLLSEKLAVKVQDIYISHKQPIHFKHIKNIIVYVRIMCLRILDKILNLIS